MKTQHIKPRSGAFDYSEAWNHWVARVIARFTRGNISAQLGRVLTEDRAKHDRARAVDIAKRWAKRKSS